MKSLPLFNINCTVVFLWLTDFEESTACGVDTLLLCDEKCRFRSEIACNGERDCSDYYDEFQCPGDSVSCDFEESPTCGYTLAGTSYKWVYNSGDTPTQDTGPQSDHTYMNSSGIT